VNPTPGSGDQPADASTDGQAAGNTLPQDGRLAAESDPGSAVAAAALAGAAASDAGPAGASAPGDSTGASAPGDSAGDDDSAGAPTTALSASATAGMDLLNDLASITAGPADDSAPAEKVAAKPAGPGPQANSTFSQALGTASAKGPAAGRPAAAPAEPTPDVRFAQVNTPKIVSGVRGELLPGGGTMHLRLDPPELGDLQISVHLHDGVMTAAFQTSNDQATRLLSHSLGNLKSMLEAQGVSVDKLHVQQGPKSNPGDSRDARDGSGRDPTPEQRQSDRREQQRKEMVQKMWDKLAGKAPVDVVA